MSAPRPVDRGSPAWMRVEQWANDRIADLRCRNDGQLDPIKTADVRGRIAALKELLALDVPAPEERVND